MAPSDPFMDLPKKVRLKIMRYLEPRSILNIIIASEVMRWTLKPISVQWTVKKSQWRVYRVMHDDDLDLGDDFLRTVLDPYLHSKRPVSTSRAETSPHNAPVRKRSLMLWVLDPRPAMHALWQWFLVQTFLWISRPLIRGTTAIVIRLLQWLGFGVQ